MQRRIWPRAWSWFWLVVAACCALATTRADALEPGTGPFGGAGPRSGAPLDPGSSGLLPWVVDDTGTPLLAWDGGRPPSLAEQAGPARAPRVLEAGQWPMFHRDLSHSGRAPVNGPTSGAIRCRFTFPIAETFSTIGAPVVSANGVIYVANGGSGSGTGFLLALNPDCTERFRTGLPGWPPGPTAPAIGADGTVYVHTNGTGNIAGVEQLVAINADGSIKWSHATNGGAGTLSGSILSSPALLPDGGIAFGSKNTLLIVLNENGTFRCARQSPTVSSIMASPVVAPDGTIYIKDPFRLFAVTPACAPLWDISVSATSGNSDASPALTPQGNLWVPATNASNKGILVSVTPAGSVRCTFQPDTVFVNTPAVTPDGGAVMVTSFQPDNGLIATDASCQRRWLHAPFFGGIPGASPAMGADGTFYWRNSFNIVATNPDGSQRWIIDANPPPDGAAPAIMADGALLMPNGGTLGRPPELLILASTPAPPPPPAPLPPVTCSPRPPVQVQVTQRPSTGVQAVIMATGANNLLASLRIGSSTNALVDVVGVAINLGPNTDIPLGQGTGQVTLHVRRAGPGAATAPLVVGDRCGTWPTVVGMGTAIP